MKTTVLAFYRRLWGPERATLAPADLLLPGWLPPPTLNPLTTFLAVALAAGTLALGHPWAALAAPVFARLAALDLTAFVLPDLYTYPLLAAGLTHALLAGQWPQALAALALIGVLLPFAALRPTAGLGGGDLKLIAALTAWLPAEAAATALALGCLAWLPLACRHPRRPQPFGVPVILGWLAILLCPHLPERLLLPILGS
jgi:prepilin signal peptidase PulO-like enzyme (type II secretory pathway)